VPLADFRRHANSANHIGIDSPAQSLLLDSAHILEKKSARLLRSRRNAKKNLFAQRCAA